MQQDYFVYVHEKDQYDFYMFHDVIRSVTPYFIIDFEEGREFLLFLTSIRDGNYPLLAIVDLADSRQAQGLVGQLRQLPRLHGLPVWVLLNALPKIMHYDNIVFAERPQHRDGWEALAHRVAAQLSAQ
jgi:hypothetical protein